MTHVYSPDLVQKKDQFWTRPRDEYLKRFYNPRVHVDPAMLAMSLGVTESRVQNRLSQLGLRNKRRHL